ncbi:MAG: hypothetical protein DRQ39_10480 [Gammaproteobacteria bacterium]|nr:MAG: hypothetical protein DRQ39_10480 [Gammaproteobacteria bacterium]
MTTETTVPKVPTTPRKKRSITTHRLYRETKAFIEGHNLGVDDEIKTLLDTMKDQILEDLDVN